MKRAAQGTSVVYTFRPHPQIALSPATAPYLLSSYEERSRLIAAPGCGRFSGGTLQS